MDKGRCRIHRHGVTIPRTISPDLATQYADDGYVIVRDAFTTDEVAELRAEALRICRGELGPVEGMRPPGPTESDDALIRRYLCIHFPHKLSPLMSRAMEHPAIVDALTRIVGPNIKSMQSMLFIKSEGKPGQAWHQDEMFIPTRDRSLAAAWIALDDATVDNGCLWVLPGSHRSGVIYPDREHSDERFDCAHEAYDFPYSEKDAVPLELPAGSVVIFNGYLLHRSLPNTRERGLRRALVNHYMRAESRLPWTKAPPGTHFAGWDFRDIVMVAGTDPYSYRGIADISRPHIRPDRDGGCDH
jgi:ectoine hydroxylase-related dioxygenase (phytanoyl-CoA dioxygenase family)